MRSVLSICSRHDSCSILFSKDSEATVLHEERFKLGRNPLDFLLESLGAEAEDC